MVESVGATVLCALGARGPRFHEGDRIATFDIGGGTVRSGVFRLEAGRRPVLEEAFRIEQRYANSADLIRDCYVFAEATMPAEQSSCVFSFAGPVDTGRGTIVKLTNHVGVEERHIPFASSVSGLFRENCGRGVEVTVINDGESGAYAEFSPQGALARLKDGDLGMALIWGNGIGGRLYQKRGNGIAKVPGAFEPGHFLMSRTLLNALGMPDMSIPASCGCQVTPNLSPAHFENYCMESVIKGPSLQKLISEFAGRELKLEDVPAALSKGIPDGRDLGILDALGTAGRILAHRLEALQRGYDDMGAISFALIGGVGVNLGQCIIPSMDDYSHKMASSLQKPAWAQTPNYYIGAFPSDQTNLWGNIFYQLGL
ncbi:MAG: hypothetical protein WC490_02740 [Candidatus Margulisiibacteriota bacterium]